jgi:hypothetical protein
VVEVVVVALSMEDGTVVAVVVLVAVLVVK